MTQAKRELATALKNEPRKMTLREERILSSNLYDDENLRVYEKKKRGFFSRALDFIRVKTGFYRVKRDKLNLIDVSVSPDSSMIAYSLSSGEIIVIKIRTVKISDDEFIKKVEDLFELDFYRLLDPRDQTRILTDHEQWKFYMEAESFEKLLEMEKLVREKNQNPKKESESNFADKKTLKNYRSGQGSRRESTFSRNISMDHRRLYVQKSIADRKLGASSRRVITDDDSRYASKRELRSDSNKLNKSKPKDDENSEKIIVRERNRISFEGRSSIGKSEDLNRSKNSKLSKNSKNSKNSRNSLKSQQNPDKNVEQKEGEENPENEEDKPSKEPEKLNLVSGLSWSSDNRYIVANYKKFKIYYHVESGVGIKIALPTLHKCFCFHSTIPEYLFYVYRSDNTTDIIVAHDLSMPYSIRLQISAP